MPVGPYLVLCLPSRSSTQNGAGFIQQGRVRRRPVHIVSRIAPRAEQGVHLIGGEAPIGGPYKSPRPEQVVQQLGRGEDRPHPLQRLAHSQLAPDPLAHRLGIEINPTRGNQRLVELGLHEPAGRVVGPESTSGFDHDAMRLFDRESQPLQAVPQTEVGANRTLPGSHGPGDEPDHPKIALESPHLGDLPTVVDADAAHHVSQGGQRDPGLAQ